MEATFQGLTINVIYVKGTVKLLLPFLSSLLQYSDCHFRLISNACTADEEEDLTKFAASENRCFFYSLNTERILLHHEVLHRILPEETSPWFAFMDSDIIATGEFLPQLNEALINRQAVFTGLPLWHENTEMKMPKSFKIMGGRYFMSHNDHLLGLSYMAIYKTESLKRFIETSGIDFRRYYWKEIPVKYQKVINELGLRKHLYDTAKVLNIIWQQEGAAMAYKEVNTLIHLGGVSGSDNRGGYFYGLKKNVLRVVPALMSTSIKAILGIKDRISLKERLNIERLVKKRRMSANILRQRLYSPNIKTDRSDMSFVPDRVVKKIEVAIEDIMPVIQEFHSSEKSHAKQQ